MEDNKASSFQKILLDNIDISIDISQLSTLKATPILLTIKETLSLMNLTQKNRRILKSAVSTCSIGAFEEPNYERGLKGTWKF